MLEFYQHRAGDYYYYGDSKYYTIHINYGTEDAVSFSAANPTVFSVDAINTVEAIKFTNTAVYKLPSNPSYLQLSAMGEAGLAPGDKIDTEQYARLKAEFGSYSYEDDYWYAHDATYRKEWESLRQHLTATEEFVHLEHKTPLEFTVHNFEENPYPDLFIPARFQSSLRRKKPFAKIHHFVFDGDKFFMSCVQAALAAIGVDYSIPDHSGTRYMKINGEYLPEQYTRDSKHYGIIRGTVSECTQVKKSIEDSVVRIVEYIQVRDKAFVSNEDMLKALQNIIRDTQRLDPKVKQQRHYNRLLEKLIAFQTLLEENIFEV